MSKAPVATLLALSVVLALSACGNKEKAAATAPAAPAPAANGMPQMPEGMQHPATKPSAEVDLAGIAKPEGGKTVAEVFSEKDALAGQKVTVRGKVVKTNAGIMNMDWVHVRDGSGAEGSNDLTVTSKGLGGSMPKVGDLVTVTGTAVLNKDFGMGYAYPVMLEDTEVKIDQPAP